MASNEFTYLRFYSHRDGDIPPISPEQLSHLCHTLSELYQMVCATVGRGGSLTWTFALPPRRGCLEIVLIHRPEAEPSQLLKPALVEAEPDYARLLYRAIFGKGGAIDRFMSGGSPTEVAPTLGEIQSMDEMKEFLAQHLRSNDITERHVRSVISTAAQLPAFRVEMLVPDEEALALSSIGDNRLGALVSLLRRTPPLFGLRTLTMAPGPRIGGRIGEREITFLIATTQYGQGAPTRLVVLWSPKGDIPPSGASVDVRAAPVGADTLVDVRIDQHPPEVFEGCDGLIQVLSVAEWRD